MWLISDAAGVLAFLSDPTSTADARHLFSQPARQGEGQRGWEELATHKNSASAAIKSRSAEANHTAHTARQRLRCLVVVQPHRQTAPRSVKPLWQSVCPSWGFSESLDIPRGERDLSNVFNEILNWGTLVSLANGTRGKKINKYTSALQCHFPQVRGLTPAEKKQKKKQAAVRYKHGRNKSSCITCPWQEGTCKAAQCDCHKFYKSEGFYCGCQARQRCRKRLKWIREAKTSVFFYLKIGGKPLTLAISYLSLPFQLFQLFQWIR